METLSKIGRKPNQFLRELETAREKATGKRSSLDHLVRSYPLEKQAREAVEGKGREYHPNQIRNNETCLLELQRFGRKSKDRRDKNIKAKRNNFHPCNPGDKNAKRGMCNSHEENLEDR